MSLSSPKSQATGPDNSSEPPAGSAPTASRSRFELYREKIRRKELPTGSIHGTGEYRAAKDRVRSARDLVWRFLQLLTPWRRQFVWILLSVTVATLIGL